ncbi:MAG: hypothetical protein KAT65_02495 [Methanophagales archaeon]|nr:hypothetical protein [Methanophagales archaeon]
MINKERDIISIFGKTAVTTIMDYYLSNHDAMHNITSLAKATKLSHITVRKGIEGPSNAGILKCLDIGSCMLITLDKESQTTKDLITFLEGQE